LYKQCFCSFQGTELSIEAVVYHYSGILYKGPSLM